ncbi:hypothetical protein VTL71DRAFT_12886 [Oculimacula yallundae]|uniref:Uncharacterized protein n=1 Tax=Oculimacula yallundae TaxID=86028 RepID=A0ABR4CNR5_9HELO
MLQIDTERLMKNLCVWTSMLQRSIQTAECFQDDENYDVKKWEMLKEVDAEPLKELTPRTNERAGLSRYRPEGLGVPPETEASHFTRVLEPYAEELDLSTDEYVKGYNCGSIKEPELDDYIVWRWALIILQIAGVLSTMVANVVAIKFGEDECQPGKVQQPPYNPSSISTAIFGLAFFKIVTAVRTATQSQLCPMYI